MTQPEVDQDQAEDQDLANAAAIADLAEQFIDQGQHALASVLFAVAAAASLGDDVTRVLQTHLHPFISGLDGALRNKAQGEREITGRGEPTA